MVRIAKSIIFAASKKYKMKTLLKYSLILSVIFAVTACGSDDENPPEANASFTASINGEVWEATSFAATNGLIQIEAVGEQIFQLSGNDDNIKLQLFLTASEISSCMSVGSYEFPNRVDILYKQASGGYFGGHTIDTDMTGQRVMTLNVTSCSNNVISGNFTASYSGNSGPNTPENIVITNGLFSNIEFDIFEQ